MRFINPVLVRVENRYLAGRVWLSLTDSAAALRTLRQRLRENSLVGVTVTNYARKVPELPFLGGRVQIATGAVKLSLDTGAPLLPRSEEHTYEHQPLMRTSHALFLLKKQT